MADASNYAVDKNRAGDQRLKKNRPAVKRPIVGRDTGPTGRPAYDHTLYNFGNSQSTQREK